MSDEYHGTEIAKKLRDEAAEMNKFLTSASSLEFDAKLWYTRFNRRDWTTFDLVRECYKAGYDRRHSTSVGEFLKLEDAYKSQRTELHKVRAERDELQVKLKELEAKLQELQTVPANTKSGKDRYFDIEEALKNQAVDGDPKVETSNGYKALKLVYFANSSNEFTVFVEVAFEDSRPVWAFREDGTHWDKRKGCLLMTPPEPKLIYINLYEAMQLGNGIHFSLSTAHNSKEEANAEANKLATSHRRFKDKCFEIDIS